MRTLVLVLLAACSLNVDYTGTYYQCNPDGTCPDGFSCQAQVCVPTDPAPPACSTHVASGGGHSCAIKEDGTAWCWGQNDFGQLGDTTATDSTVPVKVVDFPGNGVAIGAGDTYSCALDMAGAVWCWGHNDHGQLGGGTTDNRNASQVPGVANAKQIAIGTAHACALLGDGSVTCWGQNQKGELGDGQTTDHAPMVIPTLSGITQISAGDQTSCALDGAGVATCWGQNDVGQLGTGTRDPHPTPATVALPSPVREILAGRGYGCAQLTYGANFCWGSGPLGNGPLPTNGNPKQSDTPVFVAAPLPLSHLSAGNGTVCGLDVNAKVWCWGQNGDDRIADGTYRDQPQPAISTFVDVVEVSINGAHMCAVDKRGAIRCAGFNRRGELGDGKRLTQGTPQPVLGLANVKSIVAGSNHNCALLGDGTVKCWGYGGDGALGLGNTESSAVPRKVPGIDTVTELSAGSNHTCALLTDTMYCWGSDGNGKLGAASGLDATTPQLSINWGPIQHIFAGDRNTCALVGGSPFCIGSLGATPTRVDGIASAISIGTGRNHRCTVKSDNTIVCNAGDNFNGTLGNGDTMACCDQTSPVANVASVTIHNDQTCALGTDHSVKCWGLNAGNKLGVGIGQYVIATPMAIPTLQANQVALGDNLGCAIKTSDSSVACWGTGYYGGVGDSTYADRNAPVAVGTIMATQVATGANHACALLADGTVQCWGNDVDGELGDGVVLSRTPSGVRMTCP